MNLGVIITLIVLFSYFSNSLNWRYLNYGVTRFLYYIGAFIHESSHALFCILTGAKISEFRVLSHQPRVVHQKSKLPIIGAPLISFAPIVGGLLFLFVVNKLFLENYFVAVHLSGGMGLSDFAFGILRFFIQINLFQWQSWVMILLFLNVGAMIGPSIQDLKNIWPIVIISFFAHSKFFEVLGLQALSFILINIVIQILLIVFIKILNFGKYNFVRKV